MNLILIVLPAFLIFGTGYIGQKLLKLDVRSISTLALYMMMPFLTFNTFYTNKITSEYYYLILYNVALVFFVIVLTILVGRFMKMDKTSLSAVLLGTAFPNMGNYGAPIVLFAFGQTAFNYAVIIMVIQTLLINTVGIFIASYGGEKSTTAKQALVSVAKMPVLYGVIAGVLFQLLNVQMTSTMEQMIDLMGTAAIPTVMLILGMQLAEIKAEKFEWKYVSMITIIRMAVSPLIAVVLVSFMPISDMLKNVFILLAAMPIAANTTLIAVQFNTKPNLVSYVTLITTLISILSIPLTLYFLK